MFMGNVRWMRDLGVGLITTPAILFIVVIWGTIEAPSLLVKHWDFYLILLALPWAMGAALIFWDDRRTRKP